MICKDYRFPELVRSYRRMGVDRIFHWFHAANVAQSWMSAIAATIGEDRRRLNPALTFNKKRGKVLTGKGVKGVNRG